MAYIVITIAVLAIVAVVVRKWRATPSVAMFFAIDRGIRDLQRKATRNVLPDQQGEIRGFDEEAARDSTVTLHETIRFVYTIEHRDDKLVHLVSSQLKRPRGKKYQIQCMLVVILILNRQLEEAGIKQEDVKFEINESVLGTQYVAMILNAEQQAKFSASIAAAAEPFNAVDGAGV